MARRRYIPDGPKRALHVAIPQGVYEALAAEEERRRRRNFVTSKADITAQALRWFLEIALKPDTYAILDHEVNARCAQGFSVTRADLIEEAIHTLWGNPEGCK